MSSHVLEPGGKMRQALPYTDNIPLRREKMRGSPGWFSTFRQPSAQHAWDLAEQMCTLVHTGVLELAMHTHSLCHPPVRLILGKMTVPSDGCGGQG